VVQHPSEDLLIGLLPHRVAALRQRRQGRLDLLAVPFAGEDRRTAVVVKQALGRFFPLGFTNDGRYYYATLSATDDVFFADVDPGSGKITGEARKLMTRWDGV